MLTNEILHKAQEANKASLLLKLGTIKAFDCLGWQFLLRLLEWIGFGPLFIQMVEAMNATAATFILIQGRLSAPMQLKRSLRQGCPLSPPLFLIVANTLSTMIFAIADLGKIKGVPMVETGDQYTHGQFANDTSITIEANLEYVKKTFSIFRCMGQASSLYVKRIILISKDPLSGELLDLDW